MICDGACYTSTPSLLQQKQKLASGDSLLQSVAGSVQAESIRELPRLKKLYGPGRWRKRKGVARVRLSDASEHIAELHWYEASGVGRKEIKIKRIIFSL